MQNGTIFLQISRIVKVFLLLMLFDGVWLGLMGPRLYRQYLGYLFADSFAYSWAILFYLLYAAAISYFLIMPSLLYVESSMLKLFCQGFFFGLVVYAAYDLTNQATIKNWPLIITIVDMAWGATLTGVVTVVSYKLAS